jgi:cytochrome c biogenesis protein CcmG, thiol:disulfide interchange protein DsbE
VGARALIVFLAVLAVLALLGFGLLEKSESSLAVGDRAPDKELQSLDGSGSGAIADYRGRWVLVNFWASWCEPCRAEAPALQTFHERHSDRLVVLGINLDDNSEDASAFVERYGLTYPQLRDPDGDDRREAYGMVGFPESFLIDPEGQLALIRRGSVSAAFLDSEVVPLIRGGLTPS